MDLNYNFQSISQIKDKPHEERIKIWKKAKRESMRGFFIPLQLIVLGSLWLLAGWVIWHIETLWILKTGGFLGVLLFFTELSKLFFLNFMKVTVDKAVKDKILEKVGI